ncbi:hypothetical protein SAMN05421749_102350 [Acinetobacter marinus]|uniref:Uncharacterized protein n=1 Tax=Acinetobacter marinus TaxID=281375 RepID=A0A1G6HKE6_9GAMM|nr:hypothetical protein SAMN05421749_102350 [Acinetobacter marinus]
MDNDTPALSIFLFLLSLCRPLSSIAKDTIEENNHGTQTQ